MSRTSIGSLSLRNFDIRTRSTYSAEGAVVVGVSGSSGSPVAVAWAHDLAERLGVPLVAVRAYRGPGAASSALLGTRTLLERSPANLADTANRELIAHVTDAIGEKAARSVVYRVVEGERRSVLVDSSRNAALLVIDSPPNRGLSADAPFSRTLLNHAQCPVVTMPPRVAGY